MKRVRYYKDALRLRQHLDEQGTPRTVLTNGCFDLLHVGHVRYLDAAKALAEVLIVGLNSDTSVAQLKGPDRPRVPQSERAELLLALRSVDYVVVFEELNVEALLHALRPSFHAKGTDYTVTGVPEYAVSQQLGIQTVIVGDAKTHASRDLILERSKRHE